jgi:hypothetical protein
MLHHCHRYDRPLYWKGGYRADGYYYTPSGRLINGTYYIPNNRDFNFNLNISLATSFIIPIGMANNMVNPDDRVGEGNPNKFCPAVVMNIQGGKRKKLRKTKKLQKRKTKKTHKRGGRK